MNTLLLAGTRHLLYVLRDSTGSASAVLLDRAKKYFYLNGHKEIGAALGLYTVLDGELVYDSGLNETVFLVFDVLAVDGESSCGKLFSQRLEIMRTVIASRLQRPFPAESTKLKIKLFIPKRRLKDLVDVISPKGLSKIFRYGEQQHSTDGLIFQPDTPYKPFVCTDLVKWKFPDMCTVDLMVTLDEKQRPHLKCSTESDFVDCSVRSKEYIGLAKFDTFRLLADFEDHGKKKTIAEVSYDTSVGAWIYSHLRKDKVDPNFVDTVMSNLVEQAESISIEELEYRILARNESENDFQQQLAKMKKTALEFQRKRTKD